MKPRAAASTRVTGFTVATAWIQPCSSASGTYTGAKKSTRKTGSCMIGPACIVRSRIATPADQRTAAPLRSHTKPNVQPRGGEAARLREPGAAGGERVAEDDAVAVRRSEQEPPGE